MLSAACMNRLARLSALAIVLGSTVASAQLSATTTYKLLNLPTAGEENARAYGINSVGQAVGTTVPAGDTQAHSILWFNDITTDLHDAVHNVMLHPYFGIGVHEAYTISNGGQIGGTHQVRYRCDPEEIDMTQAYILSPGVLSDLGTPYPGDALVNLGTFGNVCSAHDSAVTCISNANHAVGWADVQTQLGITHAFLVTPQNGRWYAGAPINQGGNNTLMVDLSTLDAYSAVSAATGVNDYGVVVGYSYTITNTLNGQSAYHAFRVVPAGGLWFVDAGDGSNALMEDIGTLGGLNSWARGVNNAGVIVGESDTSDRHVRAFKWENGVITDLGTLGGDNSSASRINDNGDIVGWAEDANGARKGVVWIGGQIYDLNLRLIATDGSGVQLREARDINEHGQIVGWAKTVSGTQQIETAFMLRIASQAEIDEANAVVAGTSTGGDQGSTGNLGSGGGSSTAVSIEGTPENLGDGTSNPTTDGGGGTSAAAGGLCGFGLANMMPFMLLGLVAMRWTARRR
ncbi:MAG: hypothetical protein HZB38_10925 [Planctomycetes bacterium]|nr:hypothetical protein [Planctomycetota bacterium]